MIRKAARGHQAKRRRGKENTKITIDIIMHYSTKVRKIFRTFASKKCITLRRFY
jgi:hypothetical protein